MEIVPDNNFQNNNFFDKELKDYINIDKEQENIIKFYFVCCINKNLCKTRFKLFSKTSEVDISKEFIKTYSISPEYIFIICSFNQINEFKIPESIDLSIILENNINSFSINKIKINPKETLYIFDSIDNNYINFLCHLNIGRIFSIYFDYLEELENQKRNDVNKYKIKLINNYITMIKKRYSSESIFFSSLVKLFILCYYSNKEIISFLEIFFKLKYQKDNFEQTEKFANILYNYEYDPEKFLSPLYNSIKSEENQKKKNKIMEKMENHKKMLKEFIITYFIYYEHNKIKIDLNNFKYFEDLLMKILEKESDIIRYSSFIIDNIDLFSKIFSIKKNNIGFNQNIIKVENKFEINIENYDKFKEIYNLLLEKEIKQNIFFDFSKIIEKYIKIFEKNLDYLKDIYLLYKKELNIINNNKLLNKLINNIHNQGIKLNKNGQMKNKQIIDFFLFFLENKIEIDWKIKDDLFMLNGIDISSEDDILVNEIEQKQIYKYFEKEINKFLQFFTKKIIYIKDFNIFFRIMPINNYNENLSFILIDWIKNNITTFSINTCPKFEEHINIFFSILSKFENGCINDLIDFFIKNLGDYCKKLFMYFLNNNDDLSSLTKERIISFFTSCQTGKLDEIKYFIKYLEKIDDFLINTFYNQINNLVINDIDFYSRKKKNTYKLLKKLLSRKNDFIINRNSNYLKNTIKKCKNLIQDLEEKNISYNYFIRKDYIIKDESEFTKRIKLILFFLEEKEENNIEKRACDIYINLIIKYKEWELNIENLKEVKLYYEKFFNKNKEKTKNKDILVSFINKLQKKTFKELSSDKIILNNYNSYIETIKEAKEKLDLIKNSLLFQEIYESNKKEMTDQKILLDKSYKAFLNAIKMINEKPEEIHKNKYIEYFYKIGYNNEDGISQEIEWLINYAKFKINDNNKEKLISSLKILIKKKDLNLIIWVILSFIEKYDNEVKTNEKDMIFINNLKQSYDSLQKNIPSEKIKQIINDLKKNFGNITLEEKDLNYKEKLLPFFIEYQKNEYSFNYIKDLKLSKIENINEFLLDLDENELTSLDLDDFIKSIRFLNNDINTSKNIIDLINKLIYGILNEEKCGDSLKNIMKKIDKIQIFLEQISTGEKGYISEIHYILEKSSFKIFFDELEDNINLIGNYKKNQLNKEIKIEGLDYLYQRAFNSKYKLNIIGYIKTFLELYKNMIKLTYILNKLYKKYGYPIPFEIKIDCQEKKINCKFENINCLKDLNNYFYECEKKCEITYKNLINENKNIILFSGKQLFLIYSSLKNRNFDNIKDLIRYISNSEINIFDDNNFNFENKSSQDPYENMIINIKNYIKCQLSFNKKNGDFIFQKNQIFYNKIPKGFYFYIKEEDLEKFLLSYIYSLIILSKIFNKKISSTLLI